MHYKNYSAQLSNSRTQLARFLLAKLYSLTPFIRYKKKHNWHQPINNLMGQTCHVYINKRPFTHNNSFSRKTTGSGSRIAAFRSPRASSEEYGTRTFKPGTEPYHAP